MRAKNKSDKPFSIRGIALIPGEWITFDATAIPPSKMEIIRERCLVDEAEPTSAPPLDPEPVVPEQDTVRLWAHGNPRHRKPRKREADEDIEP